MTIPKQGLPGLQRSDGITAPAPALRGRGGDGVTQLGRNDHGGNTVSTSWVAQNYKELELLRQVYYGGVEHEIRKDVWPFLLGHYKFGMSKKEMEQVRGPHCHRVERWGAGPRDPGEGPLKPWPLPI